MGRPQASNNMGAGILEEPGSTPVRDPYSTSPPQIVEAMATRLLARCDFGHTL